MRWPMMPSADRNGDIIDQEAVNQLVDYALAHGVNYFDTAPPYGRGQSEAATGIALSRHPRSSYLLATKMSNQSFARDGMTGKQLYQASVQMYENSRKYLKTDYFDYYLLHNVGGGSGIPFVQQRFFDNGLIDFLLKEREAGRIRNLGFSYHGDIQVFDYLLSLHDQYHWDFVQIQMNYVDYRHASGSNFNAEYLYAELDKRGIPVIIMEPLLGGRLANLTDHLNESLQQRRPENSIASWAFRFAGSFPSVLTVLSGMTYKEHLQDNIRTYSPLDPCTEEEFELLEKTAKILVEYPSVPCTGCQYCMPCPYGLDIPSIFRHYNRCLNEGAMPQNELDSDYREQRRNFLIGLDRTVPRMRQADKCVGCHQCQPHCPQKIKIAREMQRIDKFVQKIREDGLI